MPLLNTVVITNSDPNNTPNPTSIYEDGSGNFFNVSSITNEIFKYISITNASPFATVSVQISSGLLWLNGNVVGGQFGNTNVLYTTTVGTLASTLNLLQYQPDQANPPGPGGVLVTLSVPDSGIAGVAGVLGQSFYVYCFAAGTMIACPEGERAVEAIQTGDMVLNAAGVACPVRFVGRRDMSFAQSSEHAPVRLPAGCLADGVPSRDLRVSPDHAIAIDGVLVTARALIGETIKQENVDSVVYYHIQLDGHDIVIANGTPCETLLDADDPIGFDNAAEAPITDVFLAPCLPRVSQGEAVEAIRARIRERGLVQA
jgi:hypothetical protein